MKEGLKKQKQRMDLFLKMPFRGKLCILQAFALTALVRFSILFIPFRKLASLMGRPMKETLQDIPAEQLQRAAEIAYIVQKVSRHTPWESSCLVQALCAQILLKQNKISSTIYLGIAKEGSDNLKAHAWLRCGGTILTGGAEKNLFRQIACFGSFPNE